MYKTAVD